MAKNDTTLEVIAPTIEEAIDKGLTELGLTEEDVVIEILDEGKRNLFRFTSRQARIRLTVKNGVAFDEQVLEQVNLSDDASETNTWESEIESTDSLETSEGTELVVLETVNEILGKMDVEALVTATAIEGSPDEKPIISVNIEGDDLSFLIGRKSETLNALQYITSLIVSRKLNSWVPIQLDIQNYRARRENELKKLARRMADQVITSGRKQYLEPMPANERRIIHMELRENTGVRTESSGEEPNRKVCIIPKSK